ncbi:MAG: DNA repair protein RecO [Ruminococcaceae bacterium]|nr:DNA repair protein RecO [Oscillospiraceae bacterium]
MNYSVNALVLKVQPFRSSDRICTLLTDRLGIVRAFARGAANIKNKNFGSTAQFVYGRFELYSTKDSYRIDEAAHEQLFVPLRNDLQRLALAQYLCELTIELLPAGTSSEEHLALTLSALSHLASGDRPCAMVKAVYEMRILALSGFLPDLVMCAGCGVYEAEQMYFSPTRSEIFCADCRTAQSVLNVLPLGKGALHALRHSVYADLPKVFAFSLQEQSLTQFARAAERYTLLCTDRSFPTLEFYRSMSGQGNL